MRAVRPSAGVVVTFPALAQLAGAEGPPRLPCTSAGAATGSGGRHGERGRLSSLDGAADALPSPHRRICAAPATLLAGAPSGSPVFPPPRGLRVAWAWPPSAPGGTGRHQVGGGLCSLGLQPSGLAGTSRRQAFGLLLFSSLRCSPSSWWLSPMLGGPSL